MSKEKAPFQYLPMTIVSKAMTAFEKIQVAQMNDQATFETPENIEKRAKALLKKIFGDDAQFALHFADVIDDDLHPRFAIDNMALTFMLGATPDDDCFHLSFLSAKPVRPIRSLAGVGMAMLDAMDIIDEHFLNHELGTEDE